MLTVIALCCHNTLYTEKQNHNFSIESSACKPETLFLCVTETRVQQLLPLIRMLMNSIYFYRFRRLILIPI